MVALFICILPHRCGITDEGRTKTDTGGNTVFICRKSVCFRNSYIPMQGNMTILEVLLNNTTWFSLIPVPFPNKIQIKSISNILFLWLDQACWICELFRNSVFFIYSIDNTVKYWYFIHKGVLCKSSQITRNAFPTDRFANFYNFCTNAV